MADLISAQPRAAIWFEKDCSTCKRLTRRLEMKYQSKPIEQRLHEWRTQFNLQRELFQSKFISYWQSAIDACHGESKALCLRLKPLLQPNENRDCNLSASDFASIFARKMDVVRSSTTTAPAPVTISRPLAEPLSVLRPTSADEVLRLLRRAPAKQCDLSLMLNWLVKKVSNAIAPTIETMSNLSINRQSLPCSHKKAITAKKSSLNPNDPAS
jgi:hypothetical protein